LDDADLNAAGYYSLVRNELIRWGGQTMALPISVDKSAIAPIGSFKSVELIALAAPTALTNERLGLLFDAQTMRPRITEPAFVEALTKLPLLPKERPGEAPPATTPSIPVLGYDDRLVAVTTSSRNAASAFQLLEWLAKAETTEQLDRGNSQQLSPRRTADLQVVTSADRDANISAGPSKGSRDQLNGLQFVLIPRIPGVDEYLTALDAAITSAIEHKSTPAEALQSAANDWETITDRRGRDKQRAAYLKHLEVDQN
jgi:ABC-type glycerol-3-phosphate transport system substrate-binding protein